MPTARASPSGPATVPWCTSPPATRPALLKAPSGTTGPAVGPSSRLATGSWSWARRTPSTSSTPSWSAPPGSTRSRHRASAQARPPPPRPRAAASAQGSPPPGALDLCPTMPGVSDWKVVPAGTPSREYGDQAETRTKLSALRASMFGADIDAVYLEGWANVAWLCGGRGHRVVTDSPEGLCGVLIGANGAWLLSPNNEEARLRAEPFAELPLPVVSRPWSQLPLWQAARPLLPQAARWAADVAIPGAGRAEPLLAGLRRVLGEPDMARYRGLGADAA